MSCEKTALPDDLRQLSERLQEWRNTQAPRARLPESMLVAAVEMAQRHGLHRTAKVLRIDYGRLKDRLPEGAPPARPAAPAFLELLASPSARPVECVVEMESAQGRLRVALKGAALDWAGLLRAWRDAEA